MNLELEYGYAPFPNEAVEESYNRLRAFADNKLHNEKPDVTIALESMERRDVGVIEGSKKLRFALEATQAFWVLRERLGKDFDGDVTPERGVFGFVDFAHAAGADGGEDFVRAEAGSGGEGHS